VRLYGLSQSAPDSLIPPGGDFGSPGLWRADTATVVDYGSNFLAVSGARALWPADAPWPLPVVAAGDPGRENAGVADVLGVLGGRVPIEVVATAPLVPGLGAAGTLVDYEFADRVVGDGAHLAEGAEVWLTGGAPDAVVEEIRSLLDVQGDESVADRTATLVRRGTGRIFQFQLLAAGVGVATAIIGLVALALAERRIRRPEFAALRVQGLRRRTASSSAAGTYLALVSIGIVVGVLACVPTLLVIRSALPVFADSWTATTASWWPW
jgi:FtsX-like permease family protein